MENPRASSPLPSAVGVIGLGVMGAPITRNLLAAAAGTATRVIVGHRSADRAKPLVDAGAEYAPTPRELADASDVVILMLPDLPEVEQVLAGADGLVAGVSSPTVLVIGSTSSAQGVRDLDARLSAETSGLLRVIDAPVSGGEDGAIAGTLSIMVGGDEATVDAAWSTLTAYGNPVHLGPLGAGEVAKACNQLIVSATIMALGEAAVIADRSGIDVATLFELFRGGYAGSRILETRGEKVAGREYSPSGVAKYMVKDLAFARSAAETTGTRAELLATLERAFGDLVAAGFGDQDIAVARAFVESRQL
jgi:2-hydroxy-3-oxopropionate reductase